MTDTYILFVRSVTFMVAVPMAALLLGGFIRNHYLHRPTRWLIFWLGVLFVGLATESVMRFWARSQVMLTADPHIAALTLAVPATITMVGAVGVMVTWLKWPSVRPTRNGKKG